MKLWKSMTRERRNWKDSIWEWMLTRQKGCKFRKGEGGKCVNAKINSYGEKFGWIKFVMNRLFPLKHVKNEIENLDVCGSKLWDGVASDKLCSKCDLVLRLKISALKIVWAGYGPISELVRPS